MLSHDAMLTRDAMQPRVIPARQIQCDDVLHFEGGDYRVLNYTFAVLPGYAQECVSIYL